MKRSTLLGTALLLLAGCGGKSTEKWVERMKAPDVSTRLEAVHAVHRQRRDAAIAVPALAAALHDENVYVRRDAARALGDFGANAKDAVPALTAALRDPEPSVRRAAAAALDAIARGAKP